MIARNLGVAYLPAHELVSKPHEEILRRIDAVTAAGAVNNTNAVAAALGGARKGQIAPTAQLRSSAGR
ncbi:hypothetical protein [Hyphomicrobium sulfonivorans]|uniref:hypothetical protein n=1 Tax=Hyphomicrobium sulfonivorans TaxID=121290 RepID=UPI00156EF7A1|nr:hypothetical protein [Hyphomicrobium sulfonivorans]MBI1651380.1 hypothetical protein [Hyphomicrobium sulfonivorans]